MKKGRPNKKAQTGSETWGVHPVHGTGLLMPTECLDDSRQHKRTRGAGTATGRHKSSSKRDQTWVRLRSFYGNKAQRVRADTARVSTPCYGQPPRLTSHTPTKARAPFSSYANHGEAQPAPRPLPRTRPPRRRGAAPHVPPRAAARRCRPSAASAACSP